MMNENELKKLQQTKGGMVKSEKVEGNKEVKVDELSNSNNDTKREFKRGEIYYADLSGNQGSEQGNGIEGLRPICIIQNDIGNRYSPTVIVAVLTSKMTKAKLPIHLELDSNTYNLPKDSVILFEQIRTLDKRRLRDKITELDSEIMKKVDNAIDISMKNLKSKSLLEKLPEDMRNFIITTLKHIKKLEITISEMKDAELEKDIIDLMINKKLRVLNQFIKYCTERQIDYKNFYIVNKGVSDEIAL